MLLIAGSYGPTGDVGGTCGPSWTSWSTHYLLTTSMAENALYSWTNGGKLSKKSRPNVAIWAETVDTLERGVADETVCFDRQVADRNFCRRPLSATKCSWQWLVDRHKMSAYFSRDVADKMSNSLDLQCIAGSKSCHRATQRDVVTPSLLLGHVTRSRDALLGAIYKL